jgi:hypothetical protein
VTGENVNNGPPGCQGRRDSVQTVQTLFIAGYASAVVLGGLGAYLFFGAPAEQGAGGTSGSALGVASRARSFSLRRLPSGAAGVACGGTFQ